MGATSLGSPHFEDSEGFNLAYVSDSRAAPFHWESDGACRMHVLLRSLSKLYRFYTASVDVLRVDGREEGCEEGDKLLWWEEFNSCRHVRLP